MPALNLKGRRFGRWRMISYAGVRRVGRSTKRFWNVRCACGAEREVALSALKSGLSKSCGCLKSELASKARHMVTHGMTKTRTYHAWISARMRCENPNDKDYARWGGRGIRVCKRWQKFENFLSDMGEVPTGLSLDRIRVNGNYCPSNCRWADDDQQANNRRSNFNIKVGGRRMTVRQAARKFGKSHSSLLWFAKRFPGDVAVRKALDAMPGRKAGYSGR